MTGRGRPGAEVVAVQCEVSDLMAKNAEACRPLWDSGSCPPCEDRGLRLEIIKFQRGDCRFAIRYANR
jgi:hypothetical protein